MEEPRVVVNTEQWVSEQSTRVWLSVNSDHSCSEEPFQSRGERGPCQLLHAAPSPACSHMKPGQRFPSLGFEQ